MASIGSGTPNRSTNSMRPSDPAVDESVDDLLDGSPQRGDGPGVKYGATVPR